MPVRKLRSLQEAEALLWLDPDDPDLWRQIAAMLRLGYRLAPMRFPPGVHKYRSVEAASRQARDWEARYMDDKS